MERRGGLCRWRGGKARRTQAPSPPSPNQTNRTLSLINHCRRDNINTININTPSRRLVHKDNGTHFLALPLPGAPHPLLFLVSNGGQRPLNKHPRTRGAADAIFGPLLRYEPVLGADCAPPLGAPSQPQPAPHGQQQQQQHTPQTRQQQQMQEQQQQQQQQREEADGDDDAGGDGGDGGGSGSGSDTTSDTELRGRGGGGGGEDVIVIDDDDDDDDGSGGGGDGGGAEAMVRMRWMAEGHTYANIYRAAASVVDLFSPF